MDISRRPRAKVVDLERARSIIAAEHLTASRVTLLRNKQLQGMLDSSVCRSQFIVRYFQGQLICSKLRCLF